MKMRDDKRAIEWIKQAFIVKRRGPARNLKTRNSFSEQTRKSKTISKKNKNFGQSVADSYKFFMSKKKIGSKAEAAMEWIKNN